MRSALPTVNESRRQPNAQTAPVISAATSLRRDLDETSFLKWLADNEWSGNEVAMPAVELSDGSTSPLIDLPLGMTR
jgi:hypothetical protein